MLDILVAVTCTILAIVILLLGLLAFGDSTDQTLVEPVLPQDEAALNSKAILSRWGTLTVFVGMAASCSVSSLLWIFAAYTSDKTFLLKLLPWLATVFCTIWLSLLVYSIYLEASVFFRIASAVAALGCLHVTLSSIFRKPKYAIVQNR